MYKKILAFGAISKLAFWHVLAFSVILGNFSYTSYYEYNKFDWLKLFYV